MSEQHHDLIIIKRHEDEEHEAHSSAWKVAHADFMTAMMAFFLIMWLINATDKEVRKAIANYFNPVNLADAISERRGLNDPEDVKDEGTSADGDKMSTLRATAGENTGAGDDVQQGKRERALFQDPYAVLAEISALAPPNAATTPDAAIGENGAPGTGSGDAHRDPFDPVYWQMASSPKALTDKPGSPGQMDEPDGPTPDAAAPRNGNPPAGGPSDLSGPAGPPTGKPVPGKPAPGAAAKPAPGTAPGMAAKPQAGAAPAGTVQPGTAPAGTAQSGTAPAGAAQPGAAPQPAGTAANAAAARGAAVQALRQDVQAALQQSLGNAAGPQVEVRGTREGLVISMTDDIDFSMFPVGSAVPDARLVKAMARIAAALSARPGDVIIRGYTDARPFRSANYDNWQLSAARANIAHYMLVRGGLDEKRVRSIEGFADRVPKNPADPNAPENRRIEILLREPAP